MKQLFAFLTSNTVLSPSVPIESGEVINWANVQQIEMPALEKGDVLLVQMQCEVTNDTGVNTGVDIQVLLTQGQPEAGEDFPASGQVVSIVQPCTVDVTPDGGIHHWPSFASNSVKLDEAWPAGALLTSRVLAQSTAFAQANGGLTIEGPSYGQLTCLVFR